MTFEQQASSMTQEEIVALLVKQEETERQLEWFKRQFFGEKSERRILGDSSNQLTLGECFKDRSELPAPEETIKSYQRKKRRKEPLPGTPDDSGLRFDESEVPVEEIKVEDPAVEALSPDQYEVIGTKHTYRLAERPGSYVVLKYVREVVKLKSEKIVTSPAPPAIFEKSYADASLLAGLLINKFLYHLPLYRQHQRLSACGIKLSRTTLTNFVHRTADLLEPIYYALFSSILQSEVLAMDETPIKAGRKTKGKMQKSYFWPIYGDNDEIVFPYSPSRSTKVVREALSQWCGVLVTDGYKVYERFAKQVNGVVHAQCWVHTRRTFVEAEGVEAALVKTALEYIQALYKVDEVSREKNLQDEALLEFRAQHHKPIVDEFFHWLNHVFQRQVLLPSNPFTTAANYALEREQSLRVFLEYPDVPLDTNHIERALRPIPMGRKNWLFCWTEVGARYAGIIQSILQSCRLADVKPYDYLVDVLQRIETHPVRDVHLLTPRLWKENFADNPMRSDLARQ